jgi:hypothetical protein
MHQGNSAMHHVVHQTGVIRRHSESTDVNSGDTETKAKIVS